ncbi:MAG: hypothetical protein CMO40_08510 [Verrucomicrobiaceae bacterium]|nr:hypothetical protein [Verrucomicrobiaceae bacterium]
MQLTQFDRWLREKFIYRTHIYTMRIPESGVPSQVTVEELEETPSRRYRYRLIVSAKRDLENLLAALRDGNQMFTTRVVEANPWYKPIIAPKGKSFFFRIFWWLVVMALVITAGTVVYSILSNEELKSELMEAFNLFRDG